MITIAAIAYLAGTGIGLHLDIRMIIFATMTALLGCIVSALFGWSAPAEAIFGALVTIAALQAGYASVVILNAFGMVGTKEGPIPVRVSSPSASDSPSRR